MKTNLTKIVLLIAILLMVQVLFAGNDLVIMKIDGTVVRKAAADINKITTSGDPTNMVVLAKNASSTSTPIADIDSVVFQETGTVTDIDGNTYKTIKIGDLWWMAENLKTTKYRNGTSIPKVTDNATWAALTTGAYCYYGNVDGNAATYGALYNWFAVDSAAGLAPTGWRIPTDAEWKALEMHLGMDQATADAEGWRGTDEGTKLKSTSLWNSSGNGTDEVGFAAFPGGCRSNGGSFYNMGYFALFWSASEGNAAGAWRRGLAYDYATVHRYGDGKEFGFSVRCVKD